ncbi:siderophore-interacting protein [Pelagibacterium mangrovi]|uniref:siderophore-interacting protein n=1 Tax=Pelagibacterium mangrovi TaxID=3119828 RepID=UPI002FC92C19
MVRQLRVFEVRETGFVTPNMFRVRFGGDDVTNFPPEFAGGYLKLRIPVGEDTATRTYTIRNQGADFIDVDFALHGSSGHAGLATAWALAAKSGDRLEVGGPGPVKPLPAGNGRYIVAGDMTALPAISVNLEALGPDAQCDAFLEIQAEGDIQNLTASDNVRTHWLVNPTPGSNDRLLADSIRNLDWPADLTYAWVATEFDAMRNLRKYLREERALGPDRLYISSYWKRGLVEDDHRAVKSADTAAEVVA